jgi:hypothetical protein
LTDADVASLIEMRDRILAEPQQAADALDLVGDPPGD